MNSINGRLRPVRYTAVALTAALALAACGGGTEHTGQHASASPSSSVAAGAHNAQDVAFAQGMIPHHRQAVQMAELAAGRASSAKVKDLARRIKEGQDPEIRTMSGWLTAWGEEVPTASAGMNHGGHDGMAGMMGTAELAALGKASGTEFDRQFLTMMVEHHEGAVEMATVEKEKGEYGAALTLAGRVIAAQRAEIGEMKGLL